MSDKTKAVVSAAKVYDRAKTDLLTVINSMSVEDISIFNPADHADQLISMIIDLQTAAEELLSLVR